MHSSAPQVDAGSVYVEATTICSSSHDGVGILLAVHEWKSCQAIEMAERGFVTGTLETTSSHLQDTWGHLASVFDDCPSSY